MSDMVLSLYLRDVDDGHLLTADEEKTLGRRVQRGDAEARDRMILCNLRLVVKIAKSFVGCGLPFTDLIAEGNLGLFRAVEKFDPELGFRFSTYATWWIKQAIKKSLTSDTRVVRIPSYMRELVGRYQEAQLRLADELGRTPTPEEIAQSADIPLRKLVMVKAGLRVTDMLQNACSMDAMDDAGELATETPGGSSATGHSGVDLRDRVQKILSSVSEREARILSLRYGLDGCEPLTLQEVGEEVNLTRERVRQIEKEVISRLRGMPELREAV
jgi:RNA polymerase primary sigma factor